MNTSESQNESSIFPLGEKASADYFTGTAWVKTLADDGTFNYLIGIASKIKLPPESVPPHTDGKNRCVLWCRRYIIAALPAYQEIAF